MPSSSTISSSDKSKVKSALPSSSNKILTATVARVYAAHPSKSSWSYTGIEGALAFVRDTSKNAFYLKVVDLKSGQGVVWEHELYEPLSYNQDRTFFHTIEGDDFVIAFVFADEGEAGELYKKINNRQKYAKSSSSKSSGSKLKRRSKQGASSGTGKIDKSMISAPSQFKHVAHMGFTSEKGFSSENVDPTWSALLAQLTNMGVSQKDIEKNEGFIKDFIGKRGGPAAAVSPAAKGKKVPPPAPTRAPTSARKQAPPPPAPRNRPGPPPAAAASSAPPPPPPPMPVTAPSAPPPPPMRAPAASAAAPPPPPPPPPPARQAAATSAPPPPRPPPGRSAAAAAPPPPPASSSGGPPPPPPPPAAVGAAAPAAPPPGRADLLASIQGRGVHDLRKVDPSSASATSSQGVGLAAAGSSADDGGDAAGPDLASALAAALSARKENMGDSDEEESEEEW